ncbi:hypothetical protein GCM10010399_80380 [Dactylosporangium fulvum]
MHPWSLLRNSLGRRWRPNYAPILELWRHETPNLSGFVKDHNSKIGAVIGVDARGIRIARQAPGVHKRSAIMKLAARSRALRPGA